MGAVIVTSSLALLGTSDESPRGVSPDYQTASYSFERSDIDGGSIDLTTEQPRATYYINIQATALGPDNVVTTGNPSATLEGTITSSGLGPGDDPPVVTFRAASSGGSTMDVAASDRYFQGATLVFGGNCNDPAHGQACRAQLALEMARSDDGASGGVVHVEWHFSVASNVSLSSPTSKTVGPVDPPWQIEVTR